MLAYDKMRSQSPNSARMIEIDHKYGGKPKDGQMVREGHYPKFSEMIDNIESIATEFVGFENYLTFTKLQTLKNRHEIEEALKTNKDVSELDNVDSYASIPTLN